MRKLKLENPIVLGPMLGAGTVELAVAVTNAGGMGSLAVSAMDPSAVRGAVAAIRRQTDGPFNINLFIQDIPNPSGHEIAKAQALLEPFRKELGLPPASPLPKYCENFQEQLEMLIELKLPIVSFTFGLLDAKSIERLHSSGSVVIGTATNVAEAMAWADNGADIICAQGAEAGGHRGTFRGSFESSMIGTMALVPQIVDSVKLPVIAAGAIMDGRGICAVLMLGAQAAQMGSAFLVCAEAATHPMWKQKIRDSKDTSTRTTKAFTGRAARGIVNVFMERMQAHEDDVPRYPVQNALTAGIRQAAKEANRPEFLSLWAGQAAGMTRARIENIAVADLMHELSVEIKRVVGHAKF